MTQEHPIAPPPELVQEWWDNTHGAFYEFEAVATQAARWGADQELEACRLWVSENCDIYSAVELIQFRRPKSPSLKEQAQAELHRLIALIPTEGALAMAEPIRRALESLPD